jgi:hypothetical protein
MTTAESLDGRGEPGDPLVERFTHVFGRPPTPADLSRFHRARAGLELRLPAQVRRVAATLVANV